MPPKLGTHGHSGVATWSSSSTKWSDPRMWRAVASHVLIFIHKEQIPDDAEQRCPARHCVIVDEKLRIVAAMKGSWDDPLTTVFVARDTTHTPNNTATYPAADISVEVIADLIGCDISALRGGA